MKATTVFLARVKAGLGSFPFVKVQIKRDKPIVPEGATTYYARYTGSKGRVVEALGSEIEPAYVRFLNIDSVQRKIRAGQAAAAIPTADETGPLADAIQQYIEDAKAIGNDEDTIGSKKRTLESFQKVAASKGVLDIETLRDPVVGRKVLLAYLAWMADNLRTQGVDGVRPENTYHTRMRRLGAFLNQHGIKIKKTYRAAPDDAGLLRHEEFPKYKGKKATKYSHSTIKALLAAATKDEADLIQFFLFTGFRDEEVAHVEWADLNFTDRLINVHAKPRTATRPWTWKPKDDESRETDIPLSKDFVNRMKARQERHEKQKCALIFPSTVCKPDCHLLRRIRLVAKRAGVTQPITLHKFRRTFGSYIAKTYGIDKARLCLGHSDIKTTQGYLAADGDDAREMHDTIGSVQAEYLD